MRETARADYRALLAAIASADKGDWWTVERRAAAEPWPLDVIEWRYLREQPAAFAAYVDFLRRRPDRPGLKLLRKKRVRRRSPTG
ncbi:MAG: hypothetical protein R3D56_03400 [Paracoccaceae bacterium]